MLPDLEPVGIVEELSDADREKLALVGHWIAAEMGEAVIVKDDHQPCLFLVTSGMWTAVSLVGDDPLELATFAPGDCFGEIGFFDPGPATVWVVAREPSAVWCLTRDGLEAFAEQRPAAAAKLAFAVAQRLSRKIRSLNRHLMPSANSLGVSLA